MIGSTRWSSVSILDLGKITAALALRNMQYQFDIYDLMGRVECDLWSQNEFRVHYMYYTLYNVLHPNR